MPIDPAILEYLQRAGVLAPVSTFLEGGDRIAPESPSSVPVPADIAGLIAAQNADEETRRNQALGRAGEMAAASVGGRAPQLAAFEPTDKAVKDFVLRNQLARRAVEDRAAKEKAASVAEMQKAKFDLEVKKTGGLEEYRKAQIADLTSRPGQTAAKLAADEAYRKAQLELAKERNDIARISANKPSGFGLGGGTEGGFTQAALDQAAELYAQTGALPNLGMGKAGAQLRIAIANRAAELHPEANLAGRKAGYGADVASLKKIRSQADFVNAFESTALANLDQFLQASKGVVDWKSPLFNAKAREFSQRAAGSPAMAKFNAARQVAVQEISKVLSGSMGNAVVSDSARKEADELLRPDASLAQIKAAADVLRRDMHNRRKSFEREIAKIQERASGTGAGSEQPEKREPDMTVVERRISSSGKVLEKLSDGTIREAP